MAAFLYSFSAGFMNGETNTPPERIVSSHSFFSGFKFRGTLGYAADSDKRLDGVVEQEKIAVNAA